MTLYLKSARRPALALLLALLLPALLPAQSVDPVAIDALVQEAMKAYQVPGAAVAVVRGDEVLFLKGFGVRELGGSQAVTPETLFAIGSTSKAFTTTAIALLVDEGKMRWEDPVRRHLPSFRLADPLADGEVTLRDVVSHRTGLTRHDLLWYASPWDREEILRKIGLVKLSRSFRTTYQYQNIMFLAAGQAVGAASGGSWEEFVQKRIFDPLGMTGANFSTLQAEKAADRATPHRRNKEEKLETIPWRNIDNVGPAGSINAGARDMTRWVRLQLGGGMFEGRRVISAAALAETHTPQTIIRLEGQTRANNPDTLLMSYGLGWTIQDYRGHLLVSHGGSIDGFRARVVLLPNARLGLVILANLSPTPFPEALANSLADMLLGLPKKDWNGYLEEQRKKAEAEQQARLKERREKRHQGTKTSRDLTAYAGAYEDPAYGTASVSLENGALVVHWSTFTSRLEHFHFDTFTAPDSRFEEEQFVFTLGADGEVSTLSFQGVEFRRVRPRTPVPPR